MKPQEAIEILKKNKPTSDTRECGKELCQAVDVAIEAVEKQVPKKLAFDAWSHNCPRCLETLVDNNKIHRKGVKKTLLP